MSYIGRYEVIRPLKSGGMGTVRLARAPDGDLVVLKTPHDVDEDSYERLRDEARLGARLLHASIVDTLDLFDDDGVPVLVVAFVDGISLEQLRGYGPMPTALVARIGRQIAEALDALHNATDETENSLHILHRDVSPGNIVVARDGDAKLIDLGIARFDERQADKTQDGFLRGTMRYLAPELIKGDSYSWGTDLWALGMVLWEAALGHFAYPADTDRDIVVSIIDGKPMSHGGEHVAPELRDAIAPMLNPDPAARVAAAADVAERLRLVEEVFEDARSTTAEAVRLILEKQEEADRVDGAHPHIGGAPNNEATESFSIPASDDADGANDFDESTIVSPQQTDEGGVIDIPRPVSFVGQHPFPELRDAPLEPEEKREPPRMVDEPDVESEPDGAPELAESELQGLDAPRDVTMVSGEPLSDWDALDTKTDYGVAGELGTQEVSDLNILGEISHSSEAPFAQPPVTGDHPPIASEPSGEATDERPPEVDAEEKTTVRGPPTSTPPLSVSVTAPREPSSDEYLEVDVDADDFDMLDEVRAQVEPTRVLEAFDPATAHQSDSEKNQLSPWDQAVDPRARAPRAEGLGFENYDEEAVVESVEERVEELVNEPAESLVEAVIEEDLEPTGIWVPPSPTSGPVEATAVDVDAPRLPELEEIEPPEEPTRDLMPTVEPVIPVDKNYEVTAGPGTGPRLSGRRRPSTQYISIAPRRPKGEVSGEGVAVARVGLKRVAVDRDGRRVEPKKKRKPPPGISVQAVPRIPDSNVATETQVSHDIIGTPGFEEPEELSVDPFVRTSTRTGTQPGTNPFLVEPVVRADPPEGTHAEASHLAAAVVDPYDDDDDDEQEHMNLDDVLDILDD